MRVYTVYATANPSVCLFICLSVTHLGCTKTAERYHQNSFTLSDRPIILVCHCINLTASPLRGRQIQGGSDF